MNKKLFKSSFSNVSILGVKFCVAFIMTPVIVRSLGNYDYGIWEIGVSILGYMGLLQFGIPPGIVRYVARYTATADKENLDRLFSTSFCILGSIGLICFLVLIGVAQYAPETFFKEGRSDTNYVLYITIMSFQALVVFIGLLFQSFHEGFQRYHIINAIAAFHSVVGATVLYHLLTNGYGLNALAAANTIGMAIKFFTFNRLLHLKRFGGFRFRFQDVSKETAKSLFTFGIKSFILGISGRVANSTAPIIIGSFIGPATVIFYTIPVGLVRRVSNTVAAVTLGFMPYFSELHAKKDTEQTLQTFFKASRFIISFVVCSYLGIYFLGLPFLTRWIGPSISEKGRIVFFLIATSSMLPMMNPLHGRVLTSMGRHGKLAKVRIWGALVNLILSLITVHFWGIEGVALSVLISKLIFEPIVLWVVSKNIGFRVLRYPQEVFLPLIAPLSIGCVAYYLLLQVILPETYIAIIVIGSIGSSFFMAAFFFLSISRQERRHLILSLKTFLNPKIRYHSN